MKKQLIIGIIVILLAVGLSGCNDIGLTNIGDIQANPQNYLGQEVKVRGTVMLYTIVDDNQHSIYIKTDKSISGQYYLTGIIEYGGDTVNYDDIRFYKQYYLNVTKADAV